MHGEFHHEARKACAAVPATAEGASKPAFLQRDGFELAHIQHPTQHRDARKRQRARRFACSRDFHAKPFAEIDPPCGAASAGHRGVLACLAGKDAASAAARLSTRAAVAGAGCNGKPLALRHSDG
jgi:hypothetical protein